MITIHNLNDHTTPAHIMNMFNKYDQEVSWWLRKEKHINKNK